MTDEVATLLRESMQAHNAARPRRITEKRDMARALRLWREAMVKRERAHWLDPEHTSPAWGEEQSSTPAGRDTHEMLMAFYREKLT